MRRVVDAWRAATGPGLGMYLERAQTLTFRPYDAATAQREAAQIAAAKDGVVSAIDALEAYLAQASPGRKPPR